MSPRREARLLLSADLAIAACFGIILLAVAALSPRPLSVWHTSIIFPSAIVLFLVAFALTRKLATGERRPVVLASSIGGLVLDWLPLVVAVAAYENIHDLTYVIRPDTVDASLRLLDERLLGVTPALAFDRINHPWLSEVMSAAYALYFFYPTLLLLLLYTQKDFARFRELGLALGLCLYAGLIGYVLVPAVGPRFYMATEFAHPLVGPWLTTRAAEVWNSLEKVDRDCFPSLHTALTMLTLIYFVRWRDVVPHGRRLVRIVTPPIVLLWMSTMYLRYHYGVDVIAGAVLAIAVSQLAPRMHAMILLASKKVP